jgi:hypoxanthine phosphoribosyltransferase
VVDDVLNTGRTLVYALTPFIRAKAKKIQIAVLVDRNHKNFPVMLIIRGMQLSTTLQEHVSVTIERKKKCVFMSFGYLNNILKYNAFIMQITISLQRTIHSHHIQKKIPLNN